MHRCQVAMPWEWKQAQMALSEAERQVVAVRLAQTAVRTGHLCDPRSDRVLDLVARRQPVSAADWQDARSAWAAAWVEYSLAAKRVADHNVTSEVRSVERLFRTARAAEAIACLRDAATAEGCADVLYAARLAGARLDPAWAVA